MKLFIIISLFILGIWWNNDKKREFISEKERACQLNKQCRDNKADQLAELDSIIGPKYIVRSSSGNYFLKEWHASIVAKVMLLVMTGQKAMK
jgi:hypothetical protein